MSFSPPEKGAIVTLCRSKSLRKFEVLGGVVSGTEESRGKISLDRPNRQWDYPYVILPFFSVIYDSRDFSLDMHGKWDALLVAIAGDILVKATAPNNAVGRSRTLWIPRRCPTIGIPVSIYVCSLYRLRGKGVLIAYC